jgi:hypothetical protein
VFLLTKKLKTSCKVRDIFMNLVIFEWNYFDAELLRKS